MTAPSRIYSDVHEIDYEATREFFNHRGSLAGQVSPLSLTMYQDDNPELVEARDRHEKQTVHPHLNITQQSRVLDIGCGIGRWGLELADQVSTYLGVDFSEELIEVGKQEFAKAELNENFRLQVLSATDIEPHHLITDPPFSTFIISGVLIYLNDADVAKVFQHIASLSAPEAVLFLREPVALESRLTLDRHFSDDLHHDYSAVYREHEFYDEFFAEILEPAGYHLKVNDFLFPPSLANRTETAQHYWIAQRG